MSDDMSQFLDVFLDEANEQLELLESDILELEQEPSKELLEGIFRAAHTLKGSSRAMGFVPMGELTHAMEDLFDKLRNNALTVNRELIDALFVGLDALKAMKEEIAATGNTTLDTTKQTARLRVALENGERKTPVGETKPGKGTKRQKDKELGKQEDTPKPTAEPLIQEGLTFVTGLSETEQEALQAAVATGLAIYGLKVRIAPDCVMKSVRAMLVLQSLDVVGTVLATTPNEEGLEDEAFEDEFEVVFATGQGMDTARQAARRITEISEVRIAPWPARPYRESVQVAGENAASDPATYASAVGGEINGSGNSAHEAQAGRGDAADEADGTGKEHTGARDERVADAGPLARGKSADEAQRLAGEKKGTQAQTVRVDVARLDKLLNLVGELVIDRTRLARLGALFAQIYDNSSHTDSLNETAAHIGRITDELQEEIMKARMLPIDNVFNRFPRMMRDLAQKLGKEINFVIEGKETELDRSVLEVLGDPLIHMLRNSVDHGLELPEERIATGKARTGNVWLRARHEENHIVIEIQDDGKGMDPEKLKAGALKKGLITPEAAQRMNEEEALGLIFASGFSTAQVVSDVSGRGVGMDIVRSNLQKVGARVDIESKIGHGSMFRIKLPLTLAIIRGLLVTVKECVYALPLSSVMETVQVTPQELHVINGREVIWLREKTLPLVRLRNVFTLTNYRTPAEETLEREAGRVRREGAGSKNESFYAVVVGVGDRQVGLIVDTLMGEQEVVIKTLGKFIGDIRGISGATILGDGRVALIMDVNGILQIATEEKGSIYAT